MFEKRPTGQATWAYILFVIIMFHVQVKSNVQASRPDINHQVVSSCIGQDVWISQGCKKPLQYCFA